VLGSVELHLPATCSGGKAVLEGTQAGGSRDLRSAQLARHGDEALTVEHQQDPLQPVTAATPLRPPFGWTSPLVLAVCAAAAALGGNAWVIHADGKATRALIEARGAALVAIAADAALASRAIDARLGARAPGAAVEAGLLAVDYRTAESGVVPPRASMDTGGDPGIAVFGDPRLGAWADSAVPALFGRFTSGLKVGDAVVDAGATGGSGTWLADVGLGGPGASWDWMARARVTSLSTNSLIGGTFAARTVNGTKGSPLGLVATAVTDSPRAPGGWGIYSETVVGPDSTGGAAGVEFNTVNTARMGEAGDILPYGTGTRGMTVLNLAVGGDVNVHGRTLPISAYTTYRSNGARAKAGLVFKSNALQRVGDPAAGYGRALVFPQGYGHSWYGGDDQAEVFRLYSTISDQAHAQALSFSDDGVRFVRGLGDVTALYLPFVAGSESWPQLSPAAAGGPVEVAARGGAPDIDLRLDPKGRGLLDIGSEAEPGTVSPTYRLRVKVGGVPYYIALGPG